MKVFSLTLTAFLLFGVTATHAALTIPGANGSDGSLQITQNTVIDLSQAVTGIWNADNTANAGKGIYDAEKWAVVFKYASVTVVQGATLSFTNHPSYAPVVWLVSDNVTIAGTVSVDGAIGAAAPELTEPGPGGFRGGTGYFTPGVGTSAGFGPGGAEFGSGQGFGGSYGTQGDIGPPKYGNPSLIPLLGGSGGGGDADSSAGGGAGGGALLVACAGSLTVTVNGSITANGGSRPHNHSGGGSGGALRLVADTLTGDGVLSAIGGFGWTYNGGLGRIRVEHVSDTSSLQVTPFPSVVRLADDATALLWPPADAPQVKIVSIGSQSVPDDPRASFGTSGADVVLPDVTTTQVVVETTNVEAASQIQVRVTPRANATFTVTDAVFGQEIQSTPLVIQWIANIPVSVGYAAVQVKVIRP